MILWKLLRKRCKTQQEKSLVELIVKLHNDSTIQVGAHSMNAEMGLPQGSILSPVLFNVYLEEALKSSKKLEELRRRGDLLAFADDMLVMSNSQPEVEQVVNELTKLSDDWNLRLNKRSLKSLQVRTYQRLEVLSASSK